VHAQARVNTDGRDEAVNRLIQGDSPALIISTITAPNFDTIAGQRQYGVVALPGSVAAFTGNQNGSFADHRTGSVSTFTYSIQGNILTGEQVLIGAEDAFAGVGCDLADRLMLAIEAGAVGGGGDSRCTPTGIPADSGFMRVIAGDGSILIDLDIVDTSPANVVTLLRADYDQWRLSNPCPQPPDAGVEIDAPVAIDAADTGGDAGNSASNGGGSGCGCRMSSGASAGPLLFLVLALAGYGRVRRIIRP
jgi:MYXO-CTERM domain-containing protein